MSARWHGATLWGLLGIQLPMVHAIVRLWPRASEALSMPLQLVHVVTLLLVLGFMGYVEGYKGFQQSFAPRAVGRAMVVRHKSLVWQLLAPLYCMALLDARLPRLVINWSLLIFILALIVLVTFLPQPWRGIIDAGVIFGLSWGTLAMLVMSVRAWRGSLKVDLELAGGAPAIDEG